MKRVMWASVTGLVGLGIVVGVATDWAQASGGNIGRDHVGVHASGGNVGSGPAAALTQSSSQPSQKMEKPAQSPDEDHVKAENERLKQVDPPIRPDPIGNGILGGFAGGLVAGAVGKGVAGAAVGATVGAARGAATGTAIEAGKSLLTGTNKATSAGRGASKASGGSATETNPGWQDVGAAKGATKSTTPAKPEGPPAPTAAPPSPKEPHSAGNVGSGNPSSGSGAGNSHGGQHDFLVTGGKGR
jgi:hypothetical protein